MIINIIAAGKRRRGCRAGWGTMRGVCATAPTGSAAAAATS
ncbi:hypothetical protein ISF6_0689 [Piscinibacter sakaiensis]|uniref:Uncharacterized protein n=1 Tax=Piscinibacter sakaiensis TaxID=1547922 RepID=A0A0K8NXL3_PISS1|nr:hypothetical protein ISF6_0689 [Piscinibacter sakaiensis]